MISMWRRLYCFHTKRQCNRIGKVKLGEGRLPLDNIAKRAEVCKPEERVTYKLIKDCF